MVIQMREYGNMNRKIKEYAKRTVALLGMMVVVLSGCGEEKAVDYSIEGENISQQESEQTVIESADTGKKAVGLLVGEGEIWKESWVSYTGETSEYQGSSIPLVSDINVNAEVRTPKVEQMSVVEVSEPIFDESYKEMVAKNFFDTGEIYYGTYDKLPKKELEKIRRIVEERLEQKGYSYRHYMQYDEGFWPDMTYITEEMIAEAGNAYTPVTKYDSIQYVGKVEDRLYNLTFAQGSESGYSKDKIITYEVRNMEEFCPEQYKEDCEINCEAWIKGNWVENNCTITEEAALEIAEEFVAKTGLEYSVYAFCRPLVWGDAPAYSSIIDKNEQDKWYVDGYVFYFDYGLDGVSFANDGTQDDYRDYIRYATEEEKDNLIYSHLSRLEVYVTDDGVVKMMARSPLETIKVSAGVELLPFDTIKRVMREALDSNWERLRFDAVAKDYNGMELIYFRMRDKVNENKYSYVPVWRMSEVMRDEYNNKIDIQNAVLVNAIDGSFVDIYDEL